ncbi:HAMP domain-containing sensor histidine kinase [Lentibacillus sp. Marseille-P4043]|uniref:HAMP domain-containing sensor histidine kinase n=1 Tax=Lentibacillus sp. Marseille-P4043 TaxID=2040293 RepID=UPI000D0B21B2|nr:HAMP domain-containing histidine kinase [Lentibacillus sp. Marseille-P4043]
MKLRTKIQLFTSIFMLILILLINTSVYYLFYKLSVDSELKELETQTSTIVRTLNENPEIPSKELLEAYLPTEGMIRVISQNGTALNTLTKQSEFRDLPSEFSSTQYKKVTKQKSGVSIAVVAQPIIWSDGTIVTLQVSKHLIELHKTMKVLLYVVIIASIIMLVPTVIAGRFLSGFLLKPIHALIQTMKENKIKDNWKKIELNGRSKDELYQMEVTFNDMIDHLKDNFQKQEQFVSDASHELKTPIAIVKSYAQLLERRGKDRPEVFQEAVDAIDSEADRMQKLVEQMLLLAKSKKAETDTSINLVKLCETCISAFTGAYDRTITLITKQDSVWIEGNEDQIKQVVYILIANALKYSDDEISVGIQGNGYEAIVTIEDFGQGISEAEQAKVFDRFYRVDKARSRDTGGTGLGLAIAKTIVEAHKGSISVSSMIGEGSTFRVRLPVQGNA